MIVNVTLHLGDCLEYLRTLPDKSVDAVITDPPYGIGESGRKNGTRSNLAPVRNYGDYRWDAQRMGAEYITELQRVAREQVLFGGNFYADLLPASSSWIVWDKNNSGDFADCELAWTSHDRSIRKFIWTWNGFIKEQPEQRHHPTQKPAALMRWVLENYAPAGATVLDPFMGSGTTGVACVQTGRNFIGCEIDPGYFAIAKKRIEDAQAQLNLFDMVDYGDER